MLPSFLHKVYVIAVFLFCIIEGKAQTSSPLAQAINNCAPATAQADLDINNVRTTILNGGDMWWDLLTKAQYEVPKGSKKNALYFGGLIIGGLDGSNQLHLAAQRYRNQGFDFYPGPIDSLTQATTADTCLRYDKVWKLNRSDVSTFIANYTDPNYVIPASILDWPGAIAPYVDVDGDLNYNPHNGDYPAYALNGATQNCNGNLLGEQTLWWVINDVGNTHTLTQGAPMGVEIQAQAFAYSTFDEINDMTFYQYKIINRSNNTYHDTYFGMYIDPAVGSPFDDYVGCDVARGMGYSYNGDSLDDNAGASFFQYGEHPPAVGIDFIGGPLADAFDGVDNDRDSIVDEPGERIKMSNFMNFWGDNTAMGFPNTPQDYYNFMQTLNLAGLPTFYYDIMNGSIPCKFHFPGDSDPNGWGTNGVPQAPWTEYSPTVNFPAYRQFIMSAGKFTFQPGAVQTITKAVVWARDTSGDHLASVEKLKLADDKAQQIFDNCFQIQCVPPNPIIFYSSNEMDVQFNYPNAGNTFTWTFGDCGYNVSHERNPKHTYCKPGTYDVCLTVSNECGTSSVCMPITVKYNNAGFLVQRVEGTGNCGYELEFINGMHDSVLSSPFHRVFRPVYNYSKGPVRVEVIDKNVLPQDIFTIRLNGVNDTSGWIMYRQNANDTVYSASTIKVGEAQLIPQWGLLVQVVKTIKPGSSTYNIDIEKNKNGFISSSIHYSDNSKQWLGGVVDKDTLFPTNWIRSGTFEAFDFNGFYNDYAVDYSENYENIIHRTFAPYRLCATNSLGSTVPALGEGGPAWNKFQTLSSMSLLSSIDLVITPDKTKWSRAAVLETCSDAGLSQGAAPKLNLRSAPSVDKEGQADGTGTGMGWFPGYAINLETGERLNIAFGEDSWYTIENGKDMIWNPTANELGANGEILFGGKHYIYIFGHNGDARYLATDSYLPNELKDIPMYDSCKTIKKLLDAASIASTVTLSDTYKREVYADAMWVGMPLLKVGQQLLASEVTIKIRVTKPYNTYTTYGPALNNNFPMYQFDSRNMNDPGGEQITVSEGQTLLYPNPFSSFSTIQFSNDKCEVHQLDMYDLSGKLIRRYENITTDKILIEKLSLKSGAYIYQLKKGDTPIGTGKMVMY